MGHGPPVSGRVERPGSCTRCPPHGEHGGDDPGRGPGTVEPCAGICRRSSGRDRARTTAAARPGGGARRDRGVPALDPGGLRRPPGHARRRPRDHRVSGVPRRIHGVVRHDRTHHLVARCVVARRARGGHLSTSRRDHRRLRSTGRTGTQRRRRPGGRRPMVLGERIESLHLDRRRRNGRRRGG